MTPRRISVRRQAGLSLFDLLIVVIIVMILAVYAAQKMYTAGENTVWYQAQRLARDLRHAQVLATTHGRPIEVVATGGVNGSYSVRCSAGVVPGATPCETDPIIDPVTGNSFVVSLQNNVNLAVSGTNPTFDMLGKPSSASSTTYTLTASASAVTVEVQPVTGFVKVTPP